MIGRRKLRLIARNYFMDSIVWQQSVICDTFLPLKADCCFLRQ